jgi:agmatine deiminase
MFHDPADRIALNTLQKLFPDRQVIGIHSVDLVLGLGTLHCMTMQEPPLSTDLVRIKLNS